MIYIDNRQDKIEISKDYEKLLDEVVKSTLKEEEVDREVQISIILVDNDEIHNINKEFRNIDRPTDVLSFPMLEYIDGKVYKEQYKGFCFDKFFLDEGELILGDMAISIEKTIEQSKEYNHSFERELAYLAVHSILHLLGYDHMEEKDKKRMREREEFILEKFNIKRE
jgi:probable rRNA maturation factor